jgi:3-oxoacyl-[acyl-carrier-protein] synthase II
MSSLLDVADTVHVFKTQGYKKLSPHFYTKNLCNLTAGNISIRFDFRGPNHTLIAGGSTGSYSIGNAYRMIKNGDADAMLAGAADSYLTHLDMAAFASFGVLSSKYNNSPQTASRPFDRDRDGIVVAEGSAVILLEDYEKAKARDANIYCEMIGFGRSALGDDASATNPAQSGKGIYNAMVSALREGKQNPENVSYVNAHAASSVTGMPWLFSSHALIL